MAAQATDNVLQVRDQRADLSLRAAGAAAVEQQRGSASGPVAF